MKKINLLPNFITAFGLSCGLFVIFKLILPEVDGGRYETLRFFAVILMIAGVADLLDGAVARRIRAESEFGAVLDSLSDTVVFGVAPAATVLKGAVGELGFLMPLAAMVYTICGVLRLARFNSSAQSSRGDLGEMLTQKTTFVGLPIPAAAAALVSFNLFLYSPVGRALVPILPHTRSLCLIVVMLTLGYLMVSRFSFPSVKAIQLRVASLRLVFLSVVFTVFFLYSLLYYFALFLMVCAWGYILVALSWSLVEKVMGYDGDG